MIYGIRARLIATVLGAVLVAAACNRESATAGRQSETIATSPRISSFEDFARDQDDLAPTPPMGYNSWLAHGCDVTEDIMKKTADNFVRLGLRDLGYKYINIDECWLEKERDADGNLQVDKNKFPSGIKALAAYMHGRGLKLGIYQGASHQTCRQRPGMEGNYDRDMKTFASWDVDYIKVDMCDATDNDLILAHCNDTIASEFIKRRYEKAYHAIRKSGRNMILAISAPAYMSLCGVDSVPYLHSLEWSAKYGSLWRAELDTDGGWDSLIRIYNENVGLAKAASKGHWNDPDMLATGGNKLTHVQQQTQFILWAQMASPLLLSFDISNNADAQKIAKNKDVIAVNQDPLGVQGVRILETKIYDILRKPLVDGTFAYVLFNKTAEPARIKTSPKDFQLDSNVEMADLLDGKKYQLKLGGDQLEVELPPYTARMYKVRKLKSS